MCTDSLIHSHLLRLSLGDHKTFTNRPQGRVLPLYSWSSLESPPGIETWNTSPSKRLCSCSSWCEGASALLWATLSYSVNVFPALPFRDRSASLWRKLVLTSSVRDLVLSVMNADRPVNRKLCLLSSFTKAVRYSDLHHCRRCFDSLLIITCYFKTPSSVKSCIKRTNTQSEPSYICSKRPELFSSLHSSSSDL